MRSAAIAAAASVTLLLFVFDGDQPARAGGSLEGEIAALAKAYTKQSSATDKQAAAALLRGRRWLGAASKADSGGDSELARRMVIRARADLALARELSRLAVARTKGRRLQHRLDDLRVAIKKLRGRVQARQEHIKMIKKMR